MLTLTPERRPCNARGKDGCLHGSVQDGAQRGMGLQLHFLSVSLLYDAGSLSLPGGCSSNHFH